MTWTKRMSAPTQWQIAKKEKKYVVSVAAGPHDGSALPIGIWLRDHMHLADNTKEARKILHDRQVVLNGHIVTDEHLGLDVFDIVSIPKINKHYLILVDAKGRQINQEIPEKAVNVRLVKVANKTTIRGGKTQINLTCGANFISDFACKGKDTLIVGLNGDDRFKVHEHFPYEQGALALVIGGQHTMKVGTIEQIYVQHSSLPNRVILKCTNGTEIATIEDYIYIIGKDQSYLKNWGVDA